MPEQIQGSGNPFAESDFIRDSFGGTLVACVKQIRYTVMCEADTLYRKKYKIYSDTRLFFEVEDETGKQSACKAA